MPIRICSAILIAAATLFAAPSVSPGSVDFGSTLSQPSAGAQSCVGSCTFWNTTVNFENPFAAPAGGVVVSFTLRKAAGSWTPLHLRVVSPVGPATGATWRGLAGSSPEVTPTPSEGLETFPVRLPIVVGDYVAIEFDGPAVHRSTIAGIFGAVERIEEPRLPADGSQVTTGAPVSGKELLLRTRIESDADGDGFGDETQDGCPGNAALQAACPVSAKTPLPKKKCKKAKKRRKKGKGASAEPAKKKKKKKCGKRKKRGKKRK